MGRVIRGGLETQGRERDGDDYEGDVDGPQPHIDADYGAVLERALRRIEQRKAEEPTGTKHVKRITSPTGVVPEWTRELPGEVKAA